jgi:hypothetical protein
MERLGEISRLNFQPSEYVDIRGKKQPLIQFSVEDGAANLPDGGGVPEWAR